MPPRPGPMSSPAALPRSAPSAGCAAPRRPRPPQCNLPARCAAAVATLPAADPIGNGTMSFVRTADAEAIGLANFAGTDSALTFTNDGVTFEFTGVPTAGLWDFQNVFEHELDEALGIGSALTHIVNNGALPASFEPEDYFRYSSTPGVRSITTSPTAAVFFSYNGTTDVAQFNQN